MSGGGSESGQDLNPLGVIENLSNIHNKVPVDHNYNKGPGAVFEGIKYGKYFLKILNQ